MKKAITITTINLPTVLEDYALNINKFNQKNVEMIVVGDLKTPRDVSQYCNKISNSYDLPIHYLSIESQKKYLKKYRKLDQYLPHNSFARRNIGDLFAYESGFDMVIRIDDDNYPTKDDFVGGHSVVGENINTSCISTKSDWYNVCEQLIDKDGIPFYPRGYPYSKRWVKDESHVVSKNVKIIVNAGLWLGDPDVDAVTRLCKPIDAIKFTKTYGSNFCLDIGTWCPINTQNTSYHREIIPAAFVPPNVGRYDDIWSGYLMRKVMDQSDLYVSYGSPLLKQLRNEHNLWSDLDLELNGNIHTDHLIEALQNIDVGNGDILDKYHKLAIGLDKEISQNREIFSGVIEGMLSWIDSIEKI